MNRPDEERPAQDVDAARLFYTRISRIYDVLADAGEHAARDLGLQLLDAKSDERIVEIGFGTGAKVTAIGRAVGRRGHVCGVDIADGMYRVAEQRVTAAGVSSTVELRLAAVPPIPAPDRAFDAAFMAFTLELFRDECITAVLQEIRRVLVHGGRFVVASMAKADGPGGHGLAERTYRWLHQHFPHIIDCRPIDVTNFLKRNGFVVQRTKILDIWGLPVAVCLSRIPMRRESLVSARGRLSDRSDDPWAG